MEDLDIEIVVTVVRYKSTIHWFRSDRDFWVLDQEKWRNEFISQGHNVPDFQDSYRFGIRVVNDKNAQQFFDSMAEFEIDKDELSIELAKRFPSITSWWDVQDLFPILFVDFDNLHVGAFYYEGTPMERYIADGWTSEFIDFANDYSEDIFPVKDKFWIKGGSDLLQLLNERGSQEL
ncbi:MAG: hypothetical protein LH613_18375 [Chamaesiphon sp.]|nr:hypothetical protein [Chamaesiphon sp.]